MIKITEQILINSDFQKVWGFLSDFEISLKTNRFHKKIVIPDKFSLTNNSSFNIIHNFGLGDVDMTVDIVDYLPLKRIELFKKNHIKSYAGFEHSIKYEIEKNKSQTTLIYSTAGSFNFKIQNIPFKPILINVMKKELKDIKNIIESSEQISNQIETKITAT